jgi:hypothetical protein
MQHCDLLRTLPREAGLHPPNIRFTYEHFESRGRGCSNLKLQRVLEKSCAIAIYAKCVMLGICHCSFSGFCFLLARSGLICTKSGDFMVGGVEQIAAIRTIVKSFAKGRFL